MATKAKKHVKKAVKVAVKKAKPKAKSGSKRKPKRIKAMSTDKHEHDKALAPKAAEKEPRAGGSKGAQTLESTALPPEAYMTEQEKAGHQDPVADEPAAKTTKKETK